MSRNSKNAQRHQQAQRFSAARLANNPGPAKTTPKHNKKHRQQHTQHTQKVGNEDKKNVACVCNNEVRVYGYLYNNIRPLKSIEQFYNHGQALYHAQAFNKKQK